MFCFKFHSCMQADFHHFEKYVSYAWALEGAEKNRQGVVITFSARSLVVKPGRYCLCYLTKKYSLMGISNTFQVRAPVGAVFFPWLLLGKFFCFFAMISVSEGPMAALHDVHELIRSVLTSICPNDSGDVLFQILWRRSPLVHKHTKKSTWNQPAAKAMQNSWKKEKRKKGKRKS